jgi:hypothetical protein
MAMLKKKSSYHCARYRERERESVRACESLSVTVFVLIEEKFPRCQSRWSLWMKREKRNPRKQRPEVQRKQV